MPMPKFRGGGGRTAAHKLTAAKLKRGAPNSRDGFLRTEEQKGRLQGILAKRRGEEEVEAEEGKQEGDTIAIPTLSRARPGGGGDCDKEAEVDEEAEAEKEAEAEEGEGEEDEERWAVEGFNWSCRMSKTDAEAFMERSLTDEEWACFQDCLQTVFKDFFNIVDIKAEFEKRLREGALEPELQLKGGGGSRHQRYISRRMKASDTRQQLLDDNETRQQELRMSMVQRLQKKKMKANMRDFYTANELPAPTDKILDILVDKAQKMLAEEMAAGFSETEATLRVNKKMIPIFQAFAPKPASVTAQPLEPSLAAGQEQGQEPEDEAKVENEIRENLYIELPVHKFIDTASIATSSSAAAASSSAADRCSSCWRRCRRPGPWWRRRRRRRRRAMRRGGARRCCRCCCPPRPAPAPPSS